MAASSLPMEKDWKTSTTVTRNHFYNPGLTNRTYVLAGVAFSAIISCCCIVGGTVIISTRGLSGMVHLLSEDDSNLQLQMLCLTLNFIVTVCTESIGLMHGISLRSALASESRLIFSTNLRLITAARRWLSPNGALLNGLMTVLLIISYTSVSLAWDISRIYFNDSKMIYHIDTMACLVLGIALLLQVAIAFAGMRSIEILTWSSSPFDLITALVHHAQLTPVSSRCMRGVVDLDIVEGPAKPLEVQPSAWNAHRSIQKVVLSLWVLVVACAGWAVFVRCKQNTPTPSKSWSFTDWKVGYSFIYTIMPSGGVSVQTWIVAIVIQAVIQGPLTLGLHCSDLIVNIIQNEMQWRCAATRNGLHMMNPLKAFLMNRLGLVLFVLKFMLYWMFGLSFFFLFSSSKVTIGDLRVIMYVNQSLQHPHTLVQISNLCIALLIFACVFTSASLRQPHGPQPATYGHLQTLANLVDEWLPMMWWGHKEDGTPYCHAGTSNHPLLGVKMDCVYAGSDVVSHPAIPGE
ncbi:uncharacterized protein EDB91DRAFT_1305767, partial [Suillus paluster]|uniref:uncharacterized protein n=1 Tax=Suillus paluster TaxID=48578 RepID=UPI001B863067